MRIRGVPALVMWLCLGGIAAAHDAGASRTFQTSNGRTVGWSLTVPWTWHIAELFRIEKGLIRQVEAILERAPYGRVSGWSAWDDGMTDKIQWQGTR